MSSVRKLFLYITVVLGIILFIASLASLIYESNLWWLKIFDFPRLQIFIAAIIVFVVYVILKKRWGFWQFAFTTTVWVAVIIQAYYIFPYTIFKDESVPSISKKAVDPSATFDMIVVNVLQKNRQAQELIDIINKKDPDIILAMETNDWWEKALQPLDEKYPYGIEYPLDNTYGMILYSKYKLVDSEIKFLNYDSVPSIHTKVVLPKGNIFYFHGVHPVPPGPSTKYNDKEIALEKVGKIIKGHKLPAVVAGDLNDVAWADVTRLFKADGLVNDIREGRGILPTYNAKNPFLRWPLDYVYVTSDFGVINFTRLDDFGSDHFPLYVELAKLP